MDDMEEESLPPGEWLKVPEMSRVAWAKLYGALRQAAEHRRNGFEYENSPLGAMAAEAGLQAVVDFLQCSPELMQADAVAPLLTLSAALRDLQEGRKPPFLAPRQIGRGRPGTTERRAAVIGLAARAMKELIDAGENATQAAKAVQKAMKAGRAIGWRDATPSSIKNWRARCEEGPGADISVRAIQHYKEALPPELGDKPSLRAAYLLQALSLSSARGFGE